jgi:hypothetical protein
VCSACRYGHVERDGEPGRAERGRSSPVMNRKQIHTRQGIQR